MAKTRRHAKRIWLDALPECIREEILQDRAQVRDEEVMGLTPARWGQIALMFAGGPGQDVLYCFARGLSTHAAAIYLGISERTCRNVAARYLSKLQAIKDGAGDVQGQMFCEDHMQDDPDFRFAPNRRAPTRRGRPRKVAETEALQIKMCY